MRVYAGRVGVAGNDDNEEGCVYVPVDGDTTIDDLIAEGLRRFGLSAAQPEDYRCSEMILDRGGMSQPCTFSFFQHSLIILVLNSSNRKGFEWRRKTLGNN